MIFTHNLIEYGVCDDSMTLYYYYSRSQTIFPGKKIFLGEAQWQKNFVVQSWDHHGVLLFFVKIGEQV